MTAHGAALGATIILLLPMVYFLLASLTFFLRGFADPVVGWMLHGLFKAYFLAVVLAGVLATLAFAVAGRPAVAAGLGLLAALDAAARWRFLRGTDAALGAQRSGEAGAVPALRRLHRGCIAWNATRLGLMLAAIPRLFPGV